MHPSKTPFKLNRRELIKFGCLTFGASSLVWASEAAANIALAVNRSARLRALTQRLTRLKVEQLLLGTSTANSDLISLCEKLINTHVQFLAATITDAQFKPKIDQLRSIARDLNKQSIEASNKESVSTLNQTASKALAVAQDLTVALASAAKSKEVALIEQAGRQRMLSQRMAKQYLLIAAGIEDRASFAQIDTDRGVFIESLQLLSANPLANAKIKDESSKLSASFKKYENLLAERSPDKASGKPHIAAVAAQSEVILAATHEITIAFEDVVKARESTT